MIYMREMIARFGHNNGIQWNLGEENTNTNAERADMAEWTKAVDPYDHLVVIHSYPGQINQVYDPLLSVDDFDGTSFQTTAGSIRARTVEFRDKSEAAGDPWVLAWDEDSVEQRRHRRLFEQPGLHQREDPARRTLGPSDRRRVGGELVHQGIVGPFLRPEHGHLRRVLVDVDLDRGGDQLLQ